VQCLHHKLCPILFPSHAFAHNISFLLFNTQLLPPRANPSRHQQKPVGGMIRIRSLGRSGRTDSPPPPEEPPPTTGRSSRLPDGGVTRPKPDFRLGVELSLKSPCADSRARCTSSISYSPRGGLELRSPRNLLGRPAAGGDGGCCGFMRASSSLRSFSSSSCSSLHTSRLILLIVTWRGHAEPPLATCHTQLLGDSLRDRLSLTSTASETGSLLLLQPQMQVSKWPIM
jgi:hypothetical protein